MGTPSRCVLGLLGLMGSLGGCQRYERQPLDLMAHAEAWQARDPNAEPVADYARRLLTTSGAGHVDFDASDGLSMAEAGPVALFFNPDLRVARLQAKVPLATAQEAGWWDDPQVEVKILRILNRGRGDRWKLEPPSVEGWSRASGLEIGRPTLARIEGDRVGRPWILGVGLSLTVPLSGRLAVEKQRAWAEYDSAWWQIVGREWELLTTLRSRWLKWSATQERISLTREYLGQLDNIMAVADKLAEAGELKPTDIRVLRIEQVSRRADLSNSEANARRQRLKLVAMLGLVPEAPLELRPDLTVPTVDVAPEERRAALVARHPRLQVARAEYEVAEQHLHLQIRQQYPDVTIGPGYGFEEGQSRLGFGLGFPIPLWNRNRQAIAEALAARDLARARAETAYEAVVNQLAQLEARLAAAQQHRQSLECDVAPLVDRQIEETRELIKLGEIDVLLLKDALTSSLETKLEILDAALAEALAAEELRGMLQPHRVVAADVEENEQ